MSHQALIIDSSDDTLNTLRWSLPPHFQLFIAKNHRDIETLLNQSLPDIILANIQLFNPNTPAYEIYLNHPNSKNIKLLYTVPKDQLDSYQDILINQDSNYILLPIIHQELKLRIENMLADDIYHILGICIAENTATEINKIIQPYSMKLSPCNIPTQHLIESSDCLLISDKTYQTLDPQNHHQLIKWIQSSPKPTLTLLNPNTPLETTSALFQACQDFIFSPIEPTDLKTRIKRLQLQHKPISKTTQPPPQNEPHFPILNKEISKPTLSLLDEIQNTMNHEIKNPLTNIVVGAQTLKSRNNTLSPTEQKLIEEIERSAHRIKLVVDNIQSVHHQDMYQ